MSEVKERRPRPAAITLTPGAEQRVAKLMGQAPADAIGVKLSTPRRGCSGLAYSVDYVTVEDKFDEKIETPGGTFYVDGGSILYLIGSVMDWREDDFTAGFVFEAAVAAGKASPFKHDCGKNGRRRTCLCVLSSSLPRCHRSALRHLWRSGRQPPCRSRTLMPTSAAPTRR
jgi:iron-sulfur cluster assembly protein